MIQITRKLPYTPGIMSLLPMIYVGWSDSVLSPSEMKLIEEKISSLDFLSMDDKQYLKSIINPSDPPTRGDFRHWLKAIRKWSAGQQRIQRINLMDLGLRIAQNASSEEDKIFWTNEQTRTALYEIGKALGVEGYASSKLLLDRVTGEFIEDEEPYRALNATVLNTVLEDTHRSLRKEVKTLLCDPFFRNSYEGDKDVYRIRILSQLKQLAIRGLGRHGFPKRYGGKGDTAGAIAVFETLAYGDLSLTVKFGVQFGLFGGALYQLGTRKHHQKYLEDMMNGELFGCFAMTETGHGSNVKGLETTCTYRRDRHMLVVHSPNEESGKEYIGNALHAEWAVVFAQLVVGDENHGVHAVLVPIRSKGRVAKGIRIVDSGYKMGLNGVDNGRIWFDHVEVPVQNLLDKFGSIDRQGRYKSPIENPTKRFFTMLGTLVMGRISVGLAALSAAKMAISIAGRYSMKRRQFAPAEGKPETRIIDYPTHQARLFPYLSKIYAYHFALHHLVQEYAQSTTAQHRRIETLAAGLKVEASWLCTETIQECREACGGKGYLAENKIPALKADADIFTTFEGDNTVLLQLVAKGLLTEFKQSFHDEGSRAVIRMLAMRARHSLSEINPFMKRNTDYSHITSTDFMRHALNYRYNKLLITLSQRMRKYIRQGISPHEAFLKTQVHMTIMARSYIDLYVFEQFDSKIQQITNDEVSQLLQTLKSIYGLHCISCHIGWYLENDYMEGSKSRAIRRAITKLYQTIRPEFAVLLDGFTIPDTLMDVPMAQ